MSAIIPQPRFPIEIRPGTMDDIPFMDELQKLHSKQVGWMPTKQFEGKIRAGQVLIAEESQLSVVSGPSSVATDNGPLTTDTPLGYCIGHDQYFKRDDVGIIYQMNVAPGHQRGLIGASLLKAQFERSAYGCRLYCCWCAQDIAANRFWEAMGFVPLAYRAGGRGSGVVGRKNPSQPTTHDLRPTGQRVHIFWQKRIRTGDETTPWWFPAQTSGGSIREDRIVLPIPPGTHWSDAKPLILPNAECRLPIEQQKKLPGVSNRKSQIADRKSTDKPGPLSGALFFGPPAPAPGAMKEKPVREKKPKAKNDPRLVAAARELRDRWLEQVNGGSFVLESEGVYEVSRALPGPSASVAPAAPTRPLLPAA